MSPIIALKEVTMQQVSQCSSNDWRKIRRCPDCGNNSFTMMTVDSVHSAWRIHGYGPDQYFRFLPFPPRHLLRFLGQVDSIVDIGAAHRRRHRRRCPASTPGRHAMPGRETHLAPARRGRAPSTEQAKPDPSSDWRINIQPGGHPPKDEAEDGEGVLSTGPRGVHTLHQTPFPRAPHLRDGPVANETPHDTILDRDGRFEMQMQMQRVGEGRVCPSPGVTVRCWVSIWSSSISTCDLRGSRVSSKMCTV